ncbi:MAG: hypothetical protein Q7V01_03175 [Vicinamibacterales bacterium]|nr:hypothetical protein [Vicinamibacterales bacterium]
MTMVLAAFSSGVGRVLRAPAVLAGVFAVSLLLAIPASHLVRLGIAEELGNSRVSEELVQGASLEWWDQYLETSSGLGRSFTTNVIGFAAVLDNASRFLDNQRSVPAVAALAALYLVIWLFLVGGVIDRFARDRPVRSQAFFGTCGTFFVRFLRLAVVAGAGYWLLFGPIHGWLFGSLYSAATSGLTVERTAFVVRLALYVLFGGLLVTWTLMLDYAKVRAVVEDRRSMLGAMLAGSRFALVHPKKTGLLWGLNALALILVTGLYALVAPGVTDPGGMAWTTFAIGQAYVVARLFLKLLTYASETALFQAMLAHSAYTAAPLPVWPDSPSVEAITNAAALSRPPAS